MGRCASKPKTVVTPPNRPVPNSPQAHRPEPINSPQAVAPEWMWKYLDDDNRMYMMNAGVTTIYSLLALQDPIRSIIDDVTRPIAYYLYINSDQSQTSEFYWQQAQDQLLNCQA